MAKKQIIKTDSAPAAVGVYSQGVFFGGVYYFSGQLGLDPKDLSLPASFEEQLNQVLKNIDALLKSQNLNRENVIKSTIFLTDLGKFPLVNKAYEEFFTPPYPARSCVQISALPKNALVEIEIIAG